LFARIWVSYLLVMALTIALALAVGFLIAVGRARTADALRTADFVASAQTAMSEGGIDQLERWIVFERHTHPELQMYFVDQNGRELLSRTISGRALADPRGGADAIVRDRAGRGYVMIVRRTQNFAYILNDFLQPQMLIVVAVLASGIGCAWMARYLTRPLEQLRYGIAEIVSGNLKSGMGAGLTQRRDEFGGLARDFDAMTEALRDLIASKEDLLRDVSHELRSPLARLRIAAGLARRDATQSQQGEFDRIDREVERLDAMIGQILRFSRLNERSSFKVEDLDLASLLDEAIEDARIEGAAAHKDITIKEADRVFVRGDRESLRSAVENVLRNAMRFSPPDSVTDVGVKVEDGCVCLTVADRGPGVDPALLTRLFEPFFRGDPSNGVGLGLAIAKRAMDFNGGAIFAANRPGGGLEVVMRLPIVSLSPG
jgi:signal transduction histidine kinase